MPLYGFTCDDCEVAFECQLKVADYDEPQECPECGSDQTVRDGVNKVRFNLPGDGWASKNGRVQDHMRRKNSALDAKMNERKREQPGVRLAPNVGGERVDSWSEAKKLAASKGKNTSSYDPLIRKEKSG